MIIIDPIIEKVAGWGTDVVARHVRYIIQYKQICDNLRNELENLSDVRKRLEARIYDAEDKNEEIHSDVLRWLESVVEISHQANNEILDDENQVKVSCGFCPNPIYRHKLSWKSTDLVKHVVKLSEKGGFDAGVSHPKPTEEVLKTSAEKYQAFASRSIMVENIMEKLRGQDTNMIGVYGIGGVGKTTLVEQVYRQAEKEKLFRDLVMVQVNRKPDLEKIQKGVAHDLRLKIDPDKDNQDARQSLIYSRIKEQKTLVIFDDIWGEFDLNDVGIPTVPNCKILLTSRSRAAFFNNKIHTQQNFHLGLLEEDEAWKLFEKTAGDVVKDVAILTVAQDIAKKCGRLPILIFTVAGSLRHRRTLDSWMDGRTRFEMLGRENFVENPHLVIRWSYDNLENEDLKQLFLLCAITATGNFIFLQQVLILAMGLGLYKNLSTEDARIALRADVERLKDFCLLPPSEDEYLSHDRVKIQDVVRNAAIMIATEDQHILSREEGDVLEGWPSQECLRKSTMIYLPECKFPKLPRVLKCPEVKMVYLSRPSSEWSDVKALEIPEPFFEEMKELKFLFLGRKISQSLPLSLGHMTGLQSLYLHDCILNPDAIALVGELTSLETLSLVSSRFKHLPIQISQLRRLRVLDLTDCYELTEIFPKVLSSLTSLEELSLKRSFNKWVPDGVGGERKNASLSELKNLPKLTALAIHIEQADIIPVGLFSSKLERYQILIGKHWNWEGPFKTKQLKLKLTTSIGLEQSLKVLLKSSDSLHLEVLDGLHKLLDSEDFQRLQYLHVQTGDDDSYVFNEEVLLPNLISLRVRRCHGLRFLLSLSTARSLQKLTLLKLLDCDSMEEIVSTKVSTEISEEDPAGKMLPELQYLKLKKLPNLVRFCSSGSTVEFPCVKQMKLENCSKLNAFIFDPSGQSVAQPKETDSEENLETVVQYYLFDEKVKFPRLEFLVVKGLSKFRTLWHKQIDADSFCKLKTVKVEDCSGLTSIFMPSIFEKLNVLDTLRIGHCESLVQIVELGDINVEGTIETKPAHQPETFHSEGTKFLFPKVEALAFDNLPRLRSFCVGNHVSMWPSLKRIMIAKCDQVDIFAAESSSFQKICDLGGATMKQPLFLIQEDSFPKLETLMLSPMDLWYGPPGPEKFFSELYDIVFDEGVEKPYRRIIQNTNGTLPHVRSLQLYSMSKQNTRPHADPVFPNLELLIVKCDSIENLPLFAMSFQCLKTLDVYQCGELTHLTTYSVAKRLVHLTGLTVSRCTNLAEILARDEGLDAGDFELDFRRLKHLDLRNLKSLKRFCPENCSVKLSSSATVTVTGCPIILKNPGDGLLRTIDDELTVSWMLKFSLTQNLSGKVSRLGHITSQPFSVNLYRTRNCLCRIMNRSSQLVSTYSSAGLLLCIVVMLVTYFYSSIFHPSPR